MTTSPSSFSCAPMKKQNTRIGLTLIEILIALTMTLIVLGAMMTAFQFASQEMQNGRATLEMANRLRVTEEILRSDLRNLTLDPRPYTENINPNGYFEYIEGPKRDTTLSFTSVDFDGDSIRDRYYLDDGDDHVTTADTFYPDADGDGITDPSDFDSVGGSDVNGNSVSDLFDPIAVGSSFIGDYDDIWAGTVRSEKRPFRGRYVFPTDNTTYATPIRTITSGGSFAFPPAVTAIESPLAEVVWWTEYADNNPTAPNFAVDFSESVVLYRRLLLIVPPSVQLPAFPNLEQAFEYLAVCDISARIEDRTGTTGLYHVVANTVKDLANRQVRFGHHNVDGSVIDYPFELRRNTMVVLRSADYVVGGITDINSDGATDALGIAYNGNDVMLTDVTAFDIKAYSPTASVAVPAGSNLVVEPNDVGFLSSATGDRQAMGAFVDLGHPGGGWFSGMPQVRSELAYQHRIEGWWNGLTAPAFSLADARIASLTDLVYDTWTPAYESDGIDQDGMDGIDQGTNGTDDGGPAAPDDSTELETSPPYPHPMRGIKITLRLVEKATKQVHQSSVVHSYVPE